MIKRKLNTKRGFTLIETFVAITILVVAVVGPLSMFARGIMENSYARNQLMAFYLAQEGMEIANNVKDNNIRNHTDWLTGLSDCLSPRWCNYDLYNGALNLVSTPCAANDFGAGCEMKLDNGIYKVTTGDPTIFRRAVRITPTDKREAVVESSAWWQDRFGWHRLDLTTSIFNF